MKEVVCFILKGHEYGVDVSQMKTIVHKSEPQPREGLPDFVKGIVDVHGEQIPLVDVDQLLTIREGRESTLEKKNVVLTSKCGDFAMECDGISQIVTVEDSSVQGIPGFFDRGGTSYADCIIKKKDNSLVLVMNPDRLLNEAQFEKLVELLSEMKKERIEAERKRQEEERRRKEEERKKREEEIARMNAEGEGASGADKPAGEDDQAEDAAEPDEIAAEPADEDVPAEDTAEPSDEDVPAENAAEPAGEDTVEPDEADDEPEEAQADDEEHEEEE